MGLALLCAASLPAQVSFLGAQRTVPTTGLGGPNGAAVDSSGNLYIADTGNNRIVKITPTGTQTVVSAAPLTLSSPLAVAVDGAGNLYVSDSGHGRVVKILAGGGTATALASVLTPDGLAVDANGNVFVTENVDGYIVKITSGGASSNFEIGLNSPVDVAVDAAGNVYLADESLSSIVKFPPSGGEGTNVGTSLSNIRGVAVDAAGNVYVAESGEGAVIVEITPLALQTTLATSGLGAATYFAVDSNYDLLIPDNVNSDVIEFSTISVPMGYANVCQSGAPAPCSQTATLQFSVTEAEISNVNVLTTGDSGLDFSQSAVTCSGVISPCTVSVTFQPTAPGMRTGAVEILDECLGEVLAVPLSGTGNAAEAAFLPALASGPISNDGFSDPVAVAVAGAGVYLGGPIFIADDAACVIWIASEDEDFGIYAGTYGSCGYAGDGGTATNPGELNSPEDVTLDGAGNVYIADTGNGVIRKVDMNGTITTVAGDNGLSGGFSGDGGPATNAALNQPHGIALDIAGNLYIADAGNNRIRKVDLAGIITTVAGSGAASYSGDNGTATSATLNHPLGVRVDGAGNLFIVDTHNNVIRRVDLTGKITTVAGNNGLGAGSSGNGGLATSAQLNLPGFVSVDAGGDLFISDNGNAVIRRVDGSGIITTYAIPTDFPEDLTMDPTGNLAVVDPEAEVMLLYARTIPLGLSFDPQNVNTPSAPQDVTVTNIGNQALDFAAITPPTGFNLSGPDNSCSTSSALGTGLDCILGVVFEPPTAGGYETAVALTDNSLGPAATSMQSVPVSGTGVATLTPTTTALTALPNPAFAGQTVMLTATITPTPTGETWGSVDFCLGGDGPVSVTRTRPATVRLPGQWKTRAAATPETPTCGGGTLLGTGNLGVSGVATLATSSFAVGANIVRAIYTGTGSFAVSVSDPVTVTIAAAASTTTLLTISPSPGASGQTITLTGTVAPVPTGTALGSITFCDAGSDDSVVHHIDGGKVGGSARAPSVVHPDGGGGNPCGADTLLQTVTITAAGSAMMTTAVLTVGDHNIYAVYSGNTAFTGSTSGSQDETVTAAYTVTAPQTPFTVSEGGSVQITVTVPPLGGSYTNVVTLVATGLPPRATATFNPATVTPGADGEQTIMTIQLAPVSAQLPAPMPSRPSLPPNPMWSTTVMGSLLIVMSMIPMMGAMLRRRPPARLARVVLSVGAIAVAALVMSSCNGGFAGLSTPAGQYTITITGTSGTLHPSTTVTVVVQ